MLLTSALLISSLLAVINEWNRDLEFQTILRFKVQNAKALYNLELVRIIESHIMNTQLHTRVTVIGRIEAYTFHMLVGAFKLAKL